VGQDVATNRYRRSAAPSVHAATADVSTSNAPAAMVRARARVLAAAFMTDYVAY